MTQDNINQLLSDIDNTPLPITGVVQATQVGQREVAIHVCDSQGYILSEFHLSFLPGCRRIVVFHKVSVEPQHRNMGYGTKLHEFRLAVAKKTGASIVACTTVDGNTYENRILQAHDWTRIQMSTPGVSLWTKQL